MCELAHTHTNVRKNAGKYLKLNKEKQQRKKNSCGKQFVNERCCSEAEANRKPRQTCAFYGHIPFLLRVLLVFGAVAVDGWGLVALMMTNKRTKKKTSLRKGRVVQKRLSVTGM